MMEVEMMGVGGILIDCGSGVSVYTGRREHECVRWRWSDDTLVTIGINRQYKSRLTSISPYKFVDSQTDFANRATSYPYSSTQATSNRKHPMLRP